MTEKKAKFIIIDGSALIHRAFHALPPLTTKKGELVNAVYGFTTILLKVLKELKPHYLAVTFDRAEPTFRHQEFKEYKATRVKAPDELYAQIPLVKELVKGFNIPIFEKEGFEADDLIGTISEKLKKQFKGQLETFIVTGDLDTLQLIDEQTKVYTLKKGVKETMIYDEEAVKERYGLRPDQLVDFKALRGDPSDNIPGVKGIGEKTAVSLIKDFRSLENLYQALEKGGARADKIKKRTKELLLTHKKEAFLSQKLATIVKKVPGFEFSLEKCGLKNYERDKVVKLFQQFEFKSLLDKLPQDFLAKPELEQGVLKVASERDQTSAVNYQLVDDEKKFQELFKKLEKQKGLVLDTETTGLDVLTCQLLGLSFSFQEGEAFYLNFNEKHKKHLARDKALKKLEPILEDSQVEKYGHNLKFDLAVLKSYNLEVKPLTFDTMIASYLLNFGQQTSHSLENVAFGELGYEMVSLEKLIGPKGKNQLPIEEVKAEEMAWYSCEDADITLRLKNFFTKKFEELKEEFEVNLEGIEEEVSRKRKIPRLKKVFEEIEMPLISVLEEMERQGVKINPHFIKALSQDLERQIKELEKSIYDLAQAKFNINSPEQLRGILFEKLKIPNIEIKRTKTGFSTAASELNKVKKLHPIIALIEKYRELTKLQSTYLATLPDLINPKTHRVHTSFNQTVTATGRLSSSEPNLQNIPVRSEEIGMIRKAFEAEEGFKLLSADYSQIELRIAAALSGDEKMTQAFKNDEDIHQRTAAEINGLPIKKVTPAMRRQAKAINFGIIYGLSFYGLAASIDISREAAQEFIDRYFEIHQGVREYLTKIKKTAQKYGYIETLFGRRRYLPEINSSIPNLRTAAERMAVNMPMQGTVADLMKLAMIEVAKKLPRLDKETKMILQVHDELIFEVPENKVKKMARKVKEIMEGVYDLSIPLKVDVSVGPNWHDLEKLEV